MAELIFVPLYEGQAQPAEIASWLAGQGYVMAAQFNEYYTGNGWLGWADACFVPRELTAEYSEDFRPRPVADQPTPRRGFWRADVRLLTPTLTGEASSTG